MAGTIIRGVYNFVHNLKEFSDIPCTLSDFTIEVSCLANVNKITQVSSLVLESLPVNG